MVRFPQEKFPLYYHLKGKVKTELVNSKRLWAAKLKQKKNSIWDIYKSISNKTVRPDVTSLICNLVESQPTKDPANTINEHFCSIFTPSQHMPDNFVDDGWSVTITVDEVFDILSKTNDFKSTGPDGFPAKSLRLAAHIISPPLAHIFNAIILTRHFPAAWKTCAITPVPKKQSPSVKDLRPISLLPILSKYFEKLLFSKLSPDIYRYYGKFQYGFRPGSSTSAALIHVHDAITKKLDDINTKEAAIICLDLSKAFDTVPHGSLISSLLCTGLPRGFVKLIQNYLMNRFQYVKIADSLSAPLPISSGVPQGAILSPALFCIYIRSIELQTDNVLVKYADDSTAIVSTKEEKSINHLVDKTVEDFNAQCTSLGLHMNRDKTQVLIINRRRTLTQPTLHPFCTETVNILGVIFNNHLTWSNHITTLTKKCSQRLYPLRKLKSILTTKELLIIYYATIRSLLEYASPLLIGLNDTDCYKLEILQKRALRVIYYPNPIPSNHISLKNRRVHQAKKLFNKAQESPSHALHHLIPPILPRSGAFRQPPSRTTIRLNSFIPKTTILLNN